MNPTRTPARRILAGLATAAVAAAFVTACSSATSSGGAGGTSGQSSAAAGGQAAGANSALAGDVKKLLALPTAINQTAALKSKPPAGKLIEMVGGSLPANQAVFQGLQAATAAIGWTARNVPGYKEGDPSSYISALDTALADKPVAVVMDGGLPEAGWASEIAKYKAAGVAMIPIFSGPLTTPTDSTVIANLGSPADVGATGTAVGEWVANEANGQAKKILMFNLPDIPILGAFDTQFQAVISKYCSACSITTINGTLTELTAGTLDQPIVSALQRSQYDYFASPDGEMTNGLASALKTAGVRNVKIVSTGCDPINLRNVLAGSETVCTSQPYKIAGWIAVDAALRRLEGMPIPDSDGGFPQSQLMTQANSSTWQVAESNDVPSDYAAEFKKLWLVG